MTLNTRDVTLVEINSFNGAQQKKMNKGRRKLLVAKSNDSTGCGLKKEPTPKM